MYQLSIRSKSIAVVAVLIVIVLLAFSPGTQASQQFPKGQHCVMHLDPVQPDSKEVSKQTHLGCFGTFQEAISVATGGAVNLGRDVSPRELTDEMLKANRMGSTLSSVVIGVDYDWDGFVSDGGTYTYSADEGCSPTVGFRIDTMPSGWNDRVGSARSYSECYKYIHYEHTYQNTYQAGSSITCDMGDTCEYMGYMDNKTSSERWRYQ